MISDKILLRLYLFLAILFWLLLVFTDLFLLFAEINGTEAGITIEVPYLFLSLFILLCFFYFKIKVQKAESINFIDLLWRVFSTGLVVSLAQMLVGLFFYLLSDSSLLENPLAVNFFYHLNVGVIIVFLVSTFVVWKRLILYQKNKKLLMFWRVFEYALFASLLFNFFQSDFQDWVFYILLSIFLVLILVISFNLKWIAYLNFKQKWRSILLLALVLLYLYYFLNNLFTFSQEFRLVLDLLNSVFILSLAAFIFLYALISILVILFNLPTSSVFEQKISEVLNFQRLSQSIQKGDNEDEVYDILLDSSVNAVFAKSAWLEVFHENGKKIYLSNINEDKITLVKKSIKDTGIFEYLDKQQSLQFKKSLNYKKLTHNIADPSFSSVLAVPIIIQDRQIGLLVLLKDVEDGFNKEMIDIINSFVNQTSISIENFELLSEALENERYREELKIAQRVQKSLLPSKLIHNELIDMHAFYESADEVGGDYYDYYQLSEDELAVIIGDVSGKGTSASFHMSQMKGIFHSLVQLYLSPQEFLNRANHALSKCLEKSSFITAAYYHINTKNKKIKFSRAGHCPALFYSAKEKKSYQFQNKGLGLGILRNGNFNDYIDEMEVSYSKGDILLLYTDGIIEANNKAGEEFGYERLKNVLSNNAGLRPAEIKSKIIEELYKFSESEGLNDDYTVVIVQFLS